MTLVEQILQTVPGEPLANLRRADQLWHNLRHHGLAVQPVVHQHQTPVGEVDWDVVICGGTLGIFVGAALVQRGWRVALLERGKLQGRAQEWNISRDELAVFLELNLLTTAELEQAIATEYNPARIQFLEGPELWVRDVLNVGVDPVFLLETLKARFLQGGGKLFEHTAFEQATLHPDGVVVQAAGQSLKTRLVLDAMGHFSPIVMQARQGQSPDAVCLVVGTCAQGMPQRETGDLLVTFTPIQRQCQYFWEAFPARDGRTTYMFTYLDAHRDRPSLETLFADYLHLLPEYQGVSLEQLDIQRALFGLFPCYRHSPLQMPWSRILAIGDSSGSQSPLSFGGFGALIRHLRRLDTGINEALKSDSLSAAALALLQPYQPGLSVTWLFQRAMSARIDQTLAPNQINQLLSVVFQSMAQLGETTLRPFLQDIVQFTPLTQTLLQISLRHPGLIPKIMAQVGPLALGDWMGHYLKLGIYSGLSALAPEIETQIPTSASPQQYYWHRRLEAWEYGSGRDYK